MELRPTFKLLQRVECRSYKVDGKWIAGIVIASFKHKRVMKYRVFTGRKDTFSIIEREEVDLREITTKNWTFWRK